jgi:hypothetical protein
LHQILQWHHMLSSAGYPPDSVRNLKTNTLWDGLFHAATYLFVLIGLLILWRAARRIHAPWSGKMLAGSVLMGFGIFNLVEESSTIRSSAFTMSTKPCRWTSGSIGTSAFWSGARQCWPAAGHCCEQASGKRSATCRPP